MLVLGRYRDEAIRIGDVKVIVVGIFGDKVRLGIEAPDNVPVHREEIYQAIQRERASDHPAAEIVANEIEQGNVDLPGGNAP